MKIHQNPPKSISWGLKIHIFVKSAHQAIPSPPTPRRVEGFSSQGIAQMLRFLELMIDFLEFMRVYDRFSGIYDRFS